MSGPGMRDDQNAQVLAQWQAFRYTTGEVESGVLLAERWIIAALRHRRFHDLSELNQAIREMLIS